PIAPQLYTLSLHDALPICDHTRGFRFDVSGSNGTWIARGHLRPWRAVRFSRRRSHRNAGTARPPRPSASRCRATPRQPRPARPRRLTQPHPRTRPLDPNLRRRLRTPLRATPRYHRATTRTCHLLSDIRFVGGPNLSLIE